MNTSEPRWDRNFMVRGNVFAEFWKLLKSQKAMNALFICGAGFDPRALNSIERLVTAGVNISECRLIEYSSGSGLVSDENLKRAESHRTRLRTLFPSTQLKPIGISMKSIDGRNTGGLRVSEAFRDPDSFQGFTDIIIDITALPAELYFPLVGTLLQIWQMPQCVKKLGNLHVVVCDNPEVDSMIVSEGGDKAEFMYGFAGSLQRASVGTPIPIWAPVLGENQLAHLQKIYELLRPEVIAPVLPFPARDPRRADALLLEYSPAFETWGVDPIDILYADEQNPFDLYKKLCTLASNFVESLNALGTAQIAISSHSSKIHSLGALLAAWEKQLGVAHVQPTGHIVNGTFNQDHRSGELFEIWLAGEAYV